MHGNEAANREILLQLIDYMLTNQATDPDVDFLLKNTRIHVLPSMNPDGFAIAVEGQCEGEGRYNKNYKDLNRNFHDLFECNDYIKIQPETQSIMNWLKSNDFILSANFHGGAVVANYPYDNRPENSNTYSSSNDDDVFRNLALVYASNSLIMQQWNCGLSYKNGITNGAAWYQIMGGMQDYNYWGFGCSEITIEMTCCKYPKASELPKIWLENKKSLLMYLKKANTGIKGIVRYSNGQPAENVTVKIGSREPYFRTNKNGEYYRILLDGTYEISFMFNCDVIYNQSVVVSGLKVFNVTLPAESSKSAGNYMLQRYPIFCQQKITKCKTYNTFYPIENSLTNNQTNQYTDTFNSFSLVKSYTINILISLLISVLCNHFVLFFHL